ncbi:UvrB/UvrC motif-containing protein [Alteribacillus iranensis]|uniref:Protein arginine kinase activator n=1 Tax=Alteribacillus iranensis TaxID=930128 RepID=A0A1I2F8W0_9BACI|nr:UvrB/UvrC motif-containing protein [Alteribacillus iranensis]SFF01168.1 protein arginine kinase activator [Alteribacillus iranensis]
MLCEECQKRQATLHFTKIINGQKNEMHLCEECAKDKGETFPNWNSYSIQDLLSGLLHFEQPKNGVRSSSKAPTPLVCNNCGLSYDRFTEIGKFGCSECYRTFSTKLDPIFRRVHGGNTRHAGKIPRREGGKIEVKRKIEELRTQLRRHVESEEFEEAARLRDEIRHLEFNMQDGEGE